MTRKKTHLGSPGGTPASLWPTCSLLGLSPLFFPRGWAAALRTCPWSTADHLLVREEHTALKGSRKWFTGPSPQAWGISGAGHAPGRGGRAIPTPVGNTRGRHSGASSRADHPPRLWGTLSVLSDELRSLRTIPTPLGNTSSPSTSGTTTPDIPTPVGNTPRPARPTSHAPGHPHACEERLLVVLPLDGVSRTSPRL